MNWVRNVSTVSCSAEEVTQLSLSSLSQCLEAVWNSGMEKCSDVPRIKEQSSICSCLAAFLPLPKLCYLNYSTHPFKQNKWVKFENPATEFSMSIEIKYPHSFERKIIQAQLKYNKSVQYISSILSL